MSMLLMVKAMQSKVGNPLRKLVLLKLADNANDQGECWPSYQYIADQCEMSKRSVMAHIEALISAGFLRKELRIGGEKGNKSNVYTLMIPSAGDSLGVAQEIHYPSAGDSLPPSAGAAPRTSHSLESVNKSKFGKKNNKTRSFEPSNNLTSAQVAFNVFWDSVEARRVGKAEALKAFEKYTDGKSDDEIEFILNVICHWYDLYLKEDESRLLPENKKYLKHASTWLNSEPWKADPAAYLEFKKQYYGETNEG